MRLYDPSDIIRDTFGKLVKVPSTLLQGEPMSVPGVKWVGGRYMPVNLTVTYQAIKKTTGKSIVIDVITGSLGKHKATVYQSNT